MSLFLSLSLACLYLGLATAQFDYEVTYTSTNLTTVPLVVSSSDSLNIDPSSVPQRGHLFMCPRGSNVTNPGPTIYASDTGEVIWFGAEAGLGECMALRQQYYRGQKVVNVWNGQLRRFGFGYGYTMLFNENYNMVANVTGNENGFDFHEFHIVNDGADNSTVLVTAYQPRQVDLTSVGGQSDGWLLDSLVQELDIETSEVRFSWSPYDHLNISDSVAGLGGDTGTSEDTAWDAFHINSAEKDQHGNYLVSVRHLHAVVYIEGSSGNILWAFGGKTLTPDYGFTMENGTQFFYQHDARWTDNQGAITVYDNAATFGDIQEDQARGLYLSVDQENRRVGLIQEFLSSSAGFGENGAGNYTASQGSTQRLDNGNFLVGYGSEPWTAEYLANGSAVYASYLAFEGAQTTEIDVQNYRAYKSFDWVGRPHYPPSITLERGDNNITLTVTWNGATGISEYTFFLGSSETSFETQNNVTRTGYETQWTGAPGDSQYAAIAAYSNGAELGRTGVINLSDGSLVSEGSISYEVADLPSSGDGGGNGGEDAGFRIAAVQSGVRLSAVVAVIATLLLY